MGQEVPDARVQDDADQHANKGHEGQDVADDHVDGAAAGTEEYADNLAHRAADGRDQINDATATHIRSNFCCRCCCGNSTCASNGSSCRTVGHSHVFWRDTGYINVFLNKLGHRTGLPNLIEIDGWNTLTRIYAASGGAAAIHDDGRHFTF